MFGHACARVSSVTCLETLRRLQEREKESQLAAAAADKKSGRKPRARRAGRKVRSGARNSSRASSETSASPFQTPTPDGSDDERDRDGERERMQEKLSASQPHLIQRTPLPPLSRSDSRASSESDQDAWAGGSSARPESRLSQGSGVSFAGSEIELELCATDCASYLPL